MTSTDEIRALVERANKIQKGVTKGPWTNSDGKRKPGKSVFLAKTAHEEEDIYGGSSRYGPHRDYILNALSNGAVQPDTAIANAAFCAKSRTLLPQLADRCEELLHALELACATEQRVLSGIPLATAYEPEDYLIMVAEEAQARREMKSSAPNFTSDPAKCKVEDGSLQEEEPADE